MNAKFRDRRSSLAMTSLAFCFCRPRGPSPTPKQSRKKSALTLAPWFGALIEKCALLLSFFYFKAGADKLVNLIWDEQVTFAEPSIDVIIWIRKLLTASRPSWRCPTSPLCAGLSFR
jgi:hypothetical protein